MTDKQDSMDKKKTPKAHGLETVLEENLNNSAEDKKSSPSGNDKTTWLQKSLEGPPEDKVNGSLDNGSKPQPDLDRSGANQLENDLYPAVEKTSRAAEVEKVKKSAALIVEGFGGLFSATGGLLYSFWVQASDRARSVQWPWE